MAFRPQRVLLVDDSADLREMWRLWLTSWGFTVEEAENGAEAVKKAFARPPDLILIDLAMPVLDGKATLEVLDANPITARVPVLAMSAQLDAGGVAGRFLPKPADPDQLLAHIRATLRGGPTVSHRAS